MHSKSAFVSPVPVAQSLARCAFPVGIPSSLCQRPLKGSNVTRRTRAPTMISAGTIAIELLAASALLSGGYFFIYRQREEGLELKNPATANRETVAEFAETSGSSVELWEPKVNENGMNSSSGNGTGAVTQGPDGINSVFTSAGSFAPLTDSSTSNTPINSESPRAKAPIPQGWESTSVGVFKDSNPVYGSSSTALANNNTVVNNEDPVSLAQELNWAISQIEFLDGCDGVLLIDTKEERILLQTGPLVSEENTDTYGNLPKTDNLSCKKVQDQDRKGSKLLADPRVNSVAKSRIGDSAVQVVLLSSVPDFLGPKEKLIVSSVCEKLERVLQNFTIKK